MAPMMKLIELGREAVEARKEEKIVTHCSAGVGRTGTLIALVNLTGESKGAAKDKKLSVFRTVRLLREQRMYMVERLVFVWCKEIGAICVHLRAVSYTHLTLPTICSV
eukprot:TRINITY_DN12565_c0_g1_i4.p3 TRINITY_DN12565_c0_g1~~TRINITY_DN12565_c0_g1_i4.p3  ORF type:complete len:108 (+),score=31.72 TRINITY_DN12565_c0_g1_i4:673-996(+)